MVHQGEPRSQFLGVGGEGGVEVTASFGLKNKPKTFNVNVIAD